MIKSEYKLWYVLEEKYKFMDDYLIGKTEEEVIKNFITHNKIEKEVLEKDFKVSAKLITDKDFNGLIFDRDCDDLTFRKRLREIGFNPNYVMSFGL